jgi:hypothetical protein
VRERPHLPAALHLRAGEGERGGGSAFGGDREAARRWARVCGRGVGGRGVYLLLLLTTAHYSGLPR